VPLALAPAPPPARRCQYRQRDAFLSPLWRILVDHLETFVGIYDSRFVDTYGPLKPYAEKAFGSLLLCGDPNLGVTRFSCCACNIELAVPFSCKTRTCPSCAKRRAEEVAANLVERLPVVGHRHLVVTIPKKAGLRLRILEEPKLFRKLAQIIVRVLRRQMVRQLPANRKELLDLVKPGILMTQHSFSSDLSFHPHWHIIVSDGVFTPEGDFIPLWNWDTQALLEDLRTSILRAFVRWSKLSPEVARNLQEWELERSGFSCFLSPVIPEGDKEGLARLIRYLFRSPVSYRQLSYDETTGMVRCRSKRGGYREWHATEFLAVLAQHVPRPRQHVVTYAGHYANAAGNLNQEIDDDESDGKTKENAGGFRRYSWAELLALVWRVDPLECPRCGEQMERGRTMRGEELREFLKSINRLGYPPRPPPVPPGGRGWPQESLADPFIEPDSTQFIDDTSQVLPGWES
jgi:hypothetical protein